MNPGSQQAINQGCTCPVLDNGHGRGHLKDDQKEALEMIAHKIGRIVNGDPDYTDSWHDIAGYARLVEERLTQGGE